MILSGAPPRDAAKEDGDQKCPCVICRIHPVGGLRSQLAGRHPLEDVHQGRDGGLGRVPGQQVQVIVFAVELPQLRAEAAAHLPHRVLA
jgi:hypothetical protein